MSLLRPQYSYFLIVSFAALKKRGLRHSDLFIFLGSWQILKTHVTLSCPEPIRNLSVLRYTSKTKVNMRLSDVWIEPNGFTKSAER